MTTDTEFLYLILKLCVKACNELNFIVLDHPITYVYNTVHYYQKHLIQRQSLKRRLVQSIMLALQDIRQNNWFLLEDYQQHIQSDSLDCIPDLTYYVRLVGSLVDTAHDLYATCVELMSLPVRGEILGRAILDVILKSSLQLQIDKITSWMNAVGLILTALPDSYWFSLNLKIVEVIQAPLPHDLGTSLPFQLYNFKTCQTLFAEQQRGYLLALCHAVWHHAGIGQLSQLPQFLREYLRPIIKTEEQFLYLCHLVGPFLQRLHTEKTRCLLELVIELYESLVNVDKCCEHLHYMEPITDFLYHIKYMFVGDGVKNEVEKIIRNLRQAFQLRLRFISHINIEEAMTPMTPLSVQLTS